MGHRSTVFMMLFLGGVSCMAMSCSSVDDKPVLPEKKLKVLGADTGLAKDLRLLRKTEGVGKPVLRASSQDACEAAARIFARLKFIGMSKEHVLWILGDPATISDYGLKVGPEVDAPLAYLFSQGDDGHLYRLEFKNGRVTKFQIIGID